MQKHTYYFEWNYSSLTYGIASKLLNSGGHKQVLYAILQQMVHRQITNIIAEK